MLMAVIRQTPVEVGRLVMFVSCHFEIFMLYIFCLDDCHSSISQSFKTSQEEDVSNSLFDVHT